MFIYKKTDKKIIFVSFIVILIFLLVNILSYITIKIVTKKNIYSNEYIIFKKVHFIENFIILKNIIKSF